jgi:CHAT domain-containing protein
LLASHFYDQFLDGGAQRVDVAQALRNAMLATRSELSHHQSTGGAASPGEWGAFFVIGDGRLIDEL